MAPATPLVFAREAAGAARPAGSKAFGVDYGCVWVFVAESKRLTVVT